MLTDNRFTDKDGRLLETVTDPATGLAFVIGTKGGQTGVSVYFENNLLREFFIRTESAMKLSDAFKRAAYHGS